ncbi:thiamine phosphate synthase [Pelagibacteraceae bacterium]|nr:thiamine phosphate synthase [Pelagibacteraceae bacterium]
MFAFKYKYYLYVENTKDLNLNLIKKRDKFIVIFRNPTKDQHLSKLKEFRQKCKAKGLQFYVANNLFLVNELKADGIYLSSYNQSTKHLNQLKYKYKIIGSAHNLKEINLKKKQGCKKIILSRLFKTDYNYKKKFLGVIRYNTIANASNTVTIALGGIRIKNLNSLKMVSSNFVALLSEVKKKPTITSRLF